MGAALSKSLAYLGVLKLTKSGAARGYVVQNVSNVPVQYYMFNFGTDAKDNRMSHDKSSWELAYIVPNEVKVLTPWEFSMLAASENIDGKFDGGSLRVTVMFRKINKDKVDITVKAKDEFGNIVKQSTLPTQIIAVGRPKRLVQGIPEKFNALL